MASIAEQIEHSPRRYDPRGEGGTSYTYNGDMDPFTAVTRDLYTYYQLNEACQPIIDLFTASNFKHRNSPPQVLQLPKPRTHLAPQDGIT